MTFRAVMIGLLAAIFIATMGYFNEQVPKLSHFVGNHFPIIVFGPLILVALAGSALVRAFKGRWRMRPAEVAVATALALVACNLPGSGLLRFFTRIVVMPVKFSGDAPGWHTKDMKILDYAPKRLLINDGQYDQETLRGFQAGWGKEGKPISLSRVPWHMWYKPLTAWLPLVTLVAIGSICMGLMVHRTWAERERLPYPIARFANSLLAGDGRGGIGPLLRNRLCWIGLLIVLGLHAVNGLNAWLDNKSIEIPTMFNLSVIATKFPALVKGRWVTLYNVRLWPTAFAFSCFIASDVSLAVGICPLALSLFTYALSEAGANIAGSSVEGGFLYWQHAGSYFAMALIVLYLGRRPYGQMLRGALLLGRSREVRNYEVWACRIFIFCLAAMIAIIHAFGLGLPFAIMLVLMIMAGFLVMARMNAESGLILAEAVWQPTAVFLGLFGAKALGLEAFAVIGMLGVQFTIDSRECLMPFFMNALRICNVHKVSSGSVGVTAGGVFVIAMIVAVVFGLWVDYNYGVSGGENFPTNSAPRKPFDSMIGQYNRLSLNNAVEASRAMGPLQRIANMSPDPNCLIWLGAGAALVLFFYALRLRLPWWPVHPILFLFWGTWAMSEFAWSFLLGWLVKRGLMRFGVREAKIRTFMTGVIAGDLLGGILWMIVGAIQYAATGLTPPRYFVLPPAW